MFVSNNICQHLTPRTKRVKILQLWDQNKCFKLYIETKKESYCNYNESNYFWDDESNYCYYVCIGFWKLKFT